MTRVDMMRAARESVQVVFAEYLKIRDSKAPTLVFEGKQCPTYYIQKIVSVTGGRKVCQLIARGKKNVIDLRDLIKRNVSTHDDLVLFFVDKDFDINPNIANQPDIYITRGYSIENELVDWGVIEHFIRSHFDIADAADDAALGDIQAMFDEAQGHYLRASEELNKLVFVCRRSKFRCIPGEQISTFVTFKWNPPTANSNATLDQMFNLLSIQEADGATVLEKLNDPDFPKLEPVLDWRGKFHFGFLRQFLLHVATLRKTGSHPFSRAGAIAIDPAQSGLLGALSAVAPIPECLRSFLSKNLCV